MPVMLDRAKVNAGSVSIVAVATSLQLLQKCFAVDENSS